MDSDLGHAPVERHVAPQRVAAEPPSGLQLQRGFELTADEDRLPLVVREAEYRAFMPANIGIYLERFVTLATGLTGLAPEDAQERIEAELAWADGLTEELKQGFDEKAAPKALRKYRAALSVLADLVSQEWVWRVRNHQLELAPPDFTAVPRNQLEIARQKDAIREAMQIERLAQLQPDSVRRFLGEMEEKRSRGGRPACTVLDLVANGDDLARDLRAAQRAQGDEYLDKLQRIIDPYLQLAKDEERCELTGFRYIDIWRYFRYYWSIPYFSTPGRNLFYLVRDRARPLHPVIGIAALGNSIVHLSDRERWVGWSVDALIDELAAAATEDRQRLAERTYHHLLKTIEDGVRDVDPTDLIDADELSSPTSQVVKRLMLRARDSAAQRRDFLRRHEQDLRAARKLPSRTRPLEPSQMLAGKEKTLADESVEALFVQKRAAQFADLLRAKLVFDTAGATAGPAEALNEMLRSEEGRRAVAYALKTIKQAHIGTSIMDIIICGAVPPYSHLLGGKLVCMMLTSPQVRLDYSDRYADAPSEIASKMHGADFAKPADLVFLGTTSLYHVGSSQYNRVRIPADCAGGTGEVKYLRLGETRGYGSVHFSRRTRRLLEEVVREDHGATFITRTFGEGVNPKLRLVREGLSVVGVDQDHFLRHQCRRIIYGVPLARNAREYLRNEQTRPDYFIPASSRKKATKASADIARFWKTRWLAPRVRNDEALQRVAISTTSELTMSFVAERGERDSESAAARNGDGRPNGKGGGGGGSRRPPTPAGEIGVGFLRQLYNHRSCYADRLTPSQLAAIHVETPLEQFILDRLREGVDVVLTGNPGDGKTHLIMRLLPRLKDLGVEYHPDATAEESYDAILDQWRRARKRRKAFCLAINEWPLLEFTRDHGETFAPLREVREQVDHGVIYDHQTVGPRSVVVVDLNHRNLVSLDVFKRMTATLLDERFYPECPRCPAREACDVPRARRALAQDRVRERIFQILELVSKQGHHVTMRDLQGFLAFLLTGGRACEQLVEESDTKPRPYYSLAFEGDSDFFDAIRAVFDPAAVTHPIFDEQLWSGACDPAAWTELGPPSPPPSASPGDPMEAMRAAKRRFFFEHADGAQLLQLLPQDERQFYQALEEASAQGERVVRKLIRLMNRFFDPRDDADGALRLWSRHRYDARWSPTYVSVRAVPSDTFKVEVPRLPASTAAAFTYQPDHLHLAAYRDNTRVARLTVDLNLLRTLLDAQRGLPMALRSGQLRSSGRVVSRLRVRPARRDWGRCRRDGVPCRRLAPERSETLLRRTRYVARAERGDEARKMVDRAL
jgi:hypothetical protein